MKMIKIAAVAAGAALAIAALAGCSQPSNSNANSNSAPAANTTTSNTAPASNASQTENTAPASNTAAPAATQEYIGEQAAKDAALTAAGFTAEGVQELKAELDYDAPVHYDVDFKVGTQEYDYDIDATTGAVISAHSEVDD